MNGMDEIMHHHEKGNWERAKDDLAKSGISFLFFAVLAGLGWFALDVEIANSPGVLPILFLVGAVFYGILSVKPLQRVMELSGFVQLLVTVLLWVVFAVLNAVALYTIIADIATGWSHLILLFATLAVAVFAVTCSEDYKDRRRK